MLKIYSMSLSDLRSVKSSNSSSYQSVWMATLIELVSWSGDDISLNWLLFRFLAMLLAVVVSGMLQLPKHGILSSISSLSSPIVVTPTVFLWRGFRASDCQSRLWAIMFYWVDTLKATAARCTILEELHFFFGCLGTLTLILQSGALESLSTAL